jgi:hypothetical protein
MGVTLPNGIMDISVSNNTVTTNIVLPGLQLVLSSKLVVARLFVIVFAKFLQKFALHA